MNEVGSSYDTLFASAGSFIEADYLGFLARRVPKDIADQLHDDGQPDIGMPSQTVDAADLVRPLSSRAFPTEKLSDIASLLEHIVLGHEIRLDDQRGDDPYKVIYGASLHLYCLKGRASTGMANMPALRVLASVSSKLDLESRLQVCRFLASLVPMLPSGSAEEDGPLPGDAPLSSLLLTLSLIVGSVVSDLSIFAEHTMKSERIEQAWSERFDEQAWSEVQEWMQSQEFTELFQEARQRMMRDHPELQVLIESQEGWGEPWNVSPEEVGENWKAVYHQRISPMKQMLLEMYGAAGKVRQGADRFLLAVAEGANHGAEEAG